MPSFVSGQHLFSNLRCTYYEHMMCIKNIWFAWTSSQRYQSAITINLSIYGKDSADEMIYSYSGHIPCTGNERNCGSTHTWYLLILRDPHRMANGETKHKKWLSHHLFFLFSAKDSFVEKLQAIITTEPLFFILLEMLCCHLLEIG